jgi:hypothetical protein
MAGGSVVPGPLFQLLVKRTGSTEDAMSVISDVAFRMGEPETVSTDEQLAGLALCAWGEDIERVSKSLTWRDFERFCSGILRARGYTVRQNIYLRKPRAQIDVFGISDGISIAVDCKHWARAAGYSSLAKQVQAQKARAARLRESLDRIGPIASIILVLVDQGARFVDGGAIVPVFAFGDFLDNVDVYRNQLDLR